MNYTVVALPVIISQRQLTPESVAEASFQLIMLISGFSKFTNLSKEFSELAGYTSRLAVFSEMIEVLARQNKSDNGMYLRVILGPQCNYMTHLRRLSLNYSKQKNDCRST